MIGFPGSRAIPKISVSFTVNVLPSTTVSTSKLPFNPNLSLLAVLFELGILLRFTKSPTLRL